jgi:DNA mismatch repair protein MutS
LCGVPYHSVEPYIAKLLESGKKVAICEQVEDPKQAKGVVKREVVRVFTPGVIPDGGTLDATSNNFVASAYYDGQIGGIAVADISTGHFRAAEFPSRNDLVEELVRLEPREILVVKSVGNDEWILEHIPQALITHLESTDFNEEAVTALDGGETLKSSSQLAARAAGAVYGYLKYTQRGEVATIRAVESYTLDGTMRLDEATKKNLEILRTVRADETRGSLMWLLNETRTPMGARMLKEWLCYPLMRAEAIQKRLDAVEELLGEAALRERLTDRLKDVSDLERLSTRMSLGTGNARDMLALASSLKASAQAKSEIVGKTGLLEDLAMAVDPLVELTEEVDRTIADDPPLAVKEGGMIRGGVHQELDELRKVRGEGKSALARMEAEERTRTGIGSLKVRYNKVFGYYIEVTNTHKDKVPEDYIRKQTLTNAERYITPALKEYEDKVLGAEDRIKSLEYDLFSQLRARLASCSDRVRETAKAVATLDVLNSFAQVASDNRYCKPSVDDGDLLEIEDGRHPVVERIQRGERFVPNDIKLGTDDQKLLMITGPNMAGKSTVMRQAALIVLMAQAGSFVPASKARIGVVDRIFTRIGASDALSKGQSTFMVEMTEAATILKEATPRSLIVIDEIGRGTSTFDGLAIAWSIAEELHDRVKARTLFATHYHELTELAVTREGIKNYQIAVKEWNDKVIFLRRLVPGATSHSYGIQVGALAGLGNGLLERAREILANLEKGEFDEIGRPRIAKGKEHGMSTGQMTLFTSHPIIDTIRDVDVSTLTPLEALNLLYKWKQDV